MKVIPPTEPAVGGGGGGTRSGSSDAQQGKAEQGLQTMPSRITSSSRGSRGAWDLPASPIAAPRPSMASSARREASGGRW